MTVGTAHASYGKARLARNQGDPEAARHLLFPAVQFLKERWPGLQLLKEIESFLPELGQGNGGNACP